MTLIEKNYLMMSQMEAYLMTEERSLKMSQVTVDCLSILMEASLMTLMTEYMRIFTFYRFIHLR